jgi:hypothetical protein
VTREEDRTNRLQWVRYQELSQYRLFRLLRWRRSDAFGPPSRDKPESAKPADEPDDTLPPAGDG